MKKVAIVYWSGTGNTEAMARLIAQGVKDAKGEPECIQISAFSAQEIADYDAFAFGCPSMGNEVLEESEFEPSFSEVESDLKGQTVALFGSYGWGDGEWMEEWTTRVEDDGATVIDTVIANEYPDGAEAALCIALGSKLAN